MKKLLILTMFLFTLLSSNAQEQTVRDIPMIVTGIFQENLEGSVFEAKGKLPSNTIVCILSLPDDQTEIGLWTVANSFVHHMEKVEYFQTWQVKEENGERISNCVISLAGRHLVLGYSTEDKNLHLLFINDDGFYD